jgi:transposase
MWEFRRDPRDLTGKERARLEELFTRLPRLKTLYELKVRFKRIFDTAPHRQAARRRLCALELDALDAGIDLVGFFLTYERWQEEILNYFDQHQTSAAVEGINNKARVIIKRAYGLKSATSLWNRLVLDLNLAKQAVGRGIERIRELVHGLKALFRPCCT